MKTPGHTDEDKILVHCENCGQKNRVVIYLLSQTNCGKCHLPLFQPQVSNTSAIPSANSAPSTVRSGAWGWQIWGLLLALFLVGRFGCDLITRDFGDENQEIAATDKEEHEESLSMGAYYAAEEHLRSTLKAPSTAGFPGYSGSTVVKIGPGDTFKITSYVDVQNSFGAKLRANWSGTAIYKNGIWETKVFLDEPDL